MHFQNYSYLLLSIFSMGNRSGKDSSCYAAIPSAVAHPRIRGELFLFPSIPRRLLSFCCRTGKTDRQQAHLQQCSPSARSPFSVFPSAIKYVVAVAPEHSYLHMIATVPLAVCRNYLSHDIAGIKLFEKLSVLAVCYKLVQLLAADVAIVSARLRIHKIFSTLSNAYA